MSSRGIRIVSSNELSRSQQQTLPSKRDAPAEEDGLRLIEAFCRIRNPEQRAWLIAQAQKFART